MRITLAGVPGVPKEMVAGAGVICFSDRVCASPQPHGLLPGWTPPPAHQPIRPGTGILLKLKLLAFCTAIPVKFFRKGKLSLPDPCRTVPSSAFKLAGRAWGAQNPGSPWTRPVLARWVPLPAPAPASLYEPGTGGNWGHWGSGGSAGQRHCWHEAPHLPATSPAAMAKAGQSSTHSPATVPALPSKSISHSPTPSSDPLSYYILPHPIAPSPVPLTPHSLHCPSPARLPSPWINLPLPCPALSLPALLHYPHPGSVAPSPASSPPPLLYCSLTTYITLFSTPLLTQFLFPILSPFPLPTSIASSLAPSPFPQLHHPLPCSTTPSSAPSPPPNLHCPSLTPTRAVPVSGAEV